jgi:ribonuclease HII
VDKDLRFFEKMAQSNGCHLIAGIDEAGRGPLAGPVVAAAVILPTDFNNTAITDSKKLPPKKRQCLYDLIYRKAQSVGIGIVDSIEIDRINILQSSLLAMAMAVDNLHPKPCVLLIDGKFKIQTDITQRPIIKGDSKSITIAAASIIAKVTRDRLMAHYALEYPQFGFDKHKGYPTKAHRQAILRYGCCSIHRKSFRGVIPDDKGQTSIS